MKKLGFTLLILNLLTSSCAGNKHEQALQKDLKQVWGQYFKEDFNDTRSLDVLVVTNRKSKSSDFGCGNDKFGVGFEASLKFGICKVNVPKNHSTGEITLAKEGRQSSNDYFKILDAKSSQESDFFNELKKSNRAPLVFVHGFNVRYQEAILRAAQIAYDLKYQGPIILFSWPAGAGDALFDEALFGKTYENNFGNARASSALFQNFLTNFSKNNIKINLVVHSMGHQVVLPALRELGKLNPKTPFINELILNAPDFDVSDFVKLSKIIKSTSNRVTLYCSYNDRAMLVSQKFNNNDRVGACSYLEEFDTINVSLVDDTTLGLGHGYYASRAILNDVFQVILGIDAKKRLFIKKSDPNSTEKYFLRQ